MQMIEYYQRSQSNANHYRSTPEKQSVEALFQLYGYMTFNDNKYGILSNLTRAWFFRRIETSAGGTLECARIELNGGPTTMLKAFVGIILLAEKHWFHSSPTICSPPSSRFFDNDTKTGKKDRRKAVVAAKDYAMVPTLGTYPCLPIDMRLCNWDRSSLRRMEGGGCVLRARFPRAKEEDGEVTAFCKLVDASQNPDAVHALDTEARMYASLQNLQNDVIPLVYGYYEVWGMLKFLMLQDVGSAIPDDTPISETTRASMKLALGRIHEAGFIHGDIERRNFCIGGGHVYLVDLERATVGSEDEMDAEMVAIDLL